MDTLKTETLLEKTFNCLNEAVFVVEPSTRTILACNPAVERILGYRTGEVVGRNTEFLHVNREMYEEFGLRLFSTLDVAGEFHIDYRLKKKDGTIIYTEHTVGDMFDESGNRTGLVSIVRDVTERKVAEQEVLKANKRLEYLLTAGPAVIYTAEVVGNWAATFISNNVREQMGYEPRAFLEDRDFWANRIHPDDKGRVFSGLERLLENDHHVHRYRWRHKDGGYRWMRDELKIVRDSEGKSLECVGYWTDITESMQAEQELKAAHTELQQAYERLEQVQKTAITQEKLAALGRLTAGVSHEILNPLNTIVINLHLLTNNPETPPWIASDLKDMMEQARRITKISQDLLYFSRQREPESRLLKLNDVIRRTLGLLERELRLMDIETELSLAEELPPVLADEDHLQQVILNLLNNARDLMADGGRITLNTAEIEPESGRERGLVEFRVEDTGPGIEPQHLDKVFDPFFTTKPEGEGTGLGLSICQGIIETHGGSIWAENLPAGGAVFVVRLPAGPTRDDGRD